MEPYEDKVCRICEHEVKSPSAHGPDETTTVHCWRCGDYEIVREAYLRLSWKYTDQKRHLLSGRARMSFIETGVIHRFGVEEVQAMVNMQLRDKTFSESALSVMRYLSAQRPGQQVLLTVADYPVGYCQGHRPVAC
jgi:hypothetical protein